jgi:hypothetical protein
MGPSCPCLPWNQENNTVDELGECNMLRLSSTCLAISRRWACAGSYDNPSNDVAEDSAVAPQAKGDADSEKCMVSVYCLLSFLKSCGPVVSHIDFGDVVMTVGIITVGNNSSLYAMIHYIHTRLRAVF